MTTAIVTTKGQIVIPSPMRKHLNIKKGTMCYIEERGDEIILKPLTDDYFKKAAGALGTKGKLTRALLNERAKDRGKENRR